MSCHVCQRGHPDLARRRGETADALAAAHVLHHAAPTKMRRQRCGRSADAAIARAQLLRAWCDGDACAGERLLESLEVLARRYLERLGIADPDDLVQETLISVCRRRHRAVEASSLAGYVLTTARHKLVDATRAARRREELPLGLADECEDAAEDVLVEREEAATLVTTLAGLPDDVATAIAMYFVEQRSAPEIAVTLGLPEGTVRTRIRRGVQLMRAQLGERLRAAPADAGDLDEWAAATVRSRRVSE